MYVYAYGYVYGHFGRGEGGVTNGANGSQGQGESRGGGPLLLLRALLSFLILPGAFAGLLPWFLARATSVWFLPR